MQYQIEVIVNRKLKIAIVTFGFYTGGTERQIIELIKGIDPSRFDVLVAITRAGGKMEDNLKQAGINIDYFPINSLREIGTIHQLKRLCSYLIENKIDILHTFSLIGNTFGMLAGLLARTPIMITSRRDMFGPTMILPYGLLQGVFSHFADVILTNAVAIKNMLVKQEYINPKKILVIGNGLNLSQVVSRSCGNEVRRELGINPSTPVIGVIAELKPVKGHIYLFQAIKELIKTRPELCVLLIGDSIEPAFKISLEATVRELEIQNNVIFYGRSNQVGRLLTAIDISVLPSLSEGLSNAILESMAANIPVITTNSGGNPEIVIDGETGLLVPPADSIALANAISRLLDDVLYRDYLATNARTIMVKKFSNEQMITSVENVYLQLAESRIEQTKPSTWPSLRRRLEE